MFRRLAFLSPFLRPYRGKLTAGVLAILTSALIGLLGPIVLGRAVDTLSAGVSRRSLIFFAVLIIAIEAVRGVFTFFQRLLLVTLSRNVERDLRDRYFAQLERQPQIFFYHHPTGDLMARATKDLEAVRMLCGPAIMYSANTVFTATGALAWMLWINPKLTAASLATLPLVAVATKIFGSRIHVLFERVQESFGALSTKVQENIAGARVIRAYAQEAGERASFSDYNRDYVERNRRLILWTSAFHPMLQVLVGVAFVMVIWYGGLQVVQGALSKGQFVTFLFLLGKLVWPMVAIGWVINLVQRALASLGRIRKILDTEPVITDAPDAIDPGEILGGVRFEGLDYRYDPGGPLVLEGIDFEAPAGATVALVGRTGAGKSTLLALLPRLLDPPPGGLSIDGVDILRLPLARLRAAIGAVPQETFLFSAAVADNVAFGRPEATEEEILRAARLAGLEEDLAGFPEGLATLVGERGITLSGGQKQRVALARALLREPRILLLDDCLSAVDTQTEEKILRNLREVFTGRTVFLVSHRISTAQNADLILVLDHGRIAERGTHDQLLARGGIYADLHRRQVLEEELAAV